jgi:hypothetical protein
LRIFFASLRERKEAVHAKAPSRKVRRYNLTAQTSWVVNNSDVPLGTIDR